MADVKTTKDIFDNVKDICHKDLAVFINNFAYNTKFNHDIDYKEEPNQYLVSSISLEFIRDNKSLVLRFAQVEGLDWMAGKFEYELHVHIKNSKEPILWYNEIMPYYHLELTGRDYMRGLFPQPYVAQKDEVDESQIYEYVHKYLDVLKMMLAELDFQRFLYDPNFWVHESPYK